MKRISLATAAVLFASTVTCGSLHAHETVAGALVLLHPHTIEPADDTARVADVYLIIRNTAATADRLIAASSPLAATVRFQRRAPTGDGATTSVDAIDLPAGAETAIGPRAAYIHLDGLSVPLRGYASLPLFLTFERAGRVETEVLVEERP